MELQIVSIKVSPSLFPNNLTVSNRYLAYVQQTPGKSAIHLVQTARLISLSSNDFIVGAFKSSEIVFSLNFVNLLGTWFLVVGCSGEAQVYDEHCKRLVFSATPSLFGRAEGGLYFKGATAAAGDSLMLGLSRGLVGVFSTERSVVGVSFSLQSVLPHSENPISALGARGPQLLIGDELGSVAVWTKLQTWSQVSIAQGEGLPVTSICFTNDVACIAFASGCVRLIDPASGLKLHEIWSHSRWLTGAFPHPSLPYLVTVAEDTCLNIWKVSQTDISLHSSQNFENTILTGVVVTPAEGRVVAAAYDRKDLFLTPPLH